MNSNLQYGLLGVAFSLVATIMLSQSAAAQFPLPDRQTVDAPQAAWIAPAPFVQKPQLEDSAADTASSIPAAPEAAGPQLVDSVPTSSDPSTSRPTAAEMRQARALFRSQQRMERMERNLWAGYEPLRPNWNSIPMMSSRHPERGTIVVPLYFYPQ